MKNSLRLGALIFGTTLLLGGCVATVSTEPATDQGPAAKLRLGYFDNVTHAAALVGLQNGFFEEALGDTTLSTQIFTAGPAAVEALSAGAIDAAYIGPGPAVNTFVQSGGQSATIVAGGSSGGAALVVRDGIDGPADLAGTILATPQLGNTQDVALRSWLGDEGYETSTTGGGAVTVSPTDNAQTLALFQSGKIDGAWLPEPWVSRLVLQAGGHVLVNEADLWDNGDFPTTVLLVRTDFLTEHPDTVSALLEGHVTAVDWLTQNPADAATVINAKLTADTGKALDGAVLTRALTDVTFTVDPLAATFPVSLAEAVKAGTGKDGDLNGLFNVALLNAVLAKRGEAPVSAGGLGTE
ncbi:MAG: ABC transporter substrate-binding protein [Cryobacterium sp.]|uniref:ABC transporter substrate-binding protein n=1 Tax=unclassified Cryobacterium TaxID=2649013 RepID=UPI0018C9E3CD|nr:MULTISPECIES: ABC transporter substrate-binding protein [unclassified Cryobacterium]MCY7405332.1 ABC transporter substrate-binding protein [Cryobacterium sp.]MEC5152853.1 aliphatic sulfonates family ABC transporter substrate-binding protein [Cryobacterium sp. CAN_C3]